VGSPSETQKKKKFQSRLPGWRKAQWQRYPGGTSENGLPLVTASHRVGQLPSTHDFTRDWQLAGALKQIPGLGMQFRVKSAHAAGAGHGWSGSQRPLGASHSPGDAMETPRLRLQHSFK
jgi:hypothetical protein